MKRLISIGLIGFVLSCFSGNAQESIPEFLLDNNWLEQRDRKDWEKHIKGA